MGLPARVYVAWASRPCSSTALPYTMIQGCRRWLCTSCARRIYRPHHAFDFARPIRANKCSLQAAQGPVENPHAETSTRERVKRTLTFLLIMLCGGILLTITPFIAFVSAGAIPFHDGPNAGHISGPGWGRWVESVAPTASAIGLGIALTATVALAILGIVALRKRS